MKFANPVFLLLIIPLLVYYVRKFLSGNFDDGTPALKISSVSLYRRSRDSWIKYYPVISSILMFSALLFLIIAMARPQGGKSVTNDRVYGVDIVLAIDVSGSMLNVDRIPSNLPHSDMFGKRIYYDPDHKILKYNRLNSAKTVILDYIEKQRFNRIGIVVFAGYSYTKSPLTLDKKMLYQVVSNIRFYTDNDGTAIGLGIANSVNRLKHSEAKSRIIILLTDGMNNRGMISPEDAADIAKQYGIKIYTIGLGNPEGYLAPASLQFNEYVFQMGQGIDEDNLRKIAETTGGKFYRAYQPTALAEIYEDINELEKSKIQVKRRVLYEEKFFIFLSGAFVCLILYGLIQVLIWKIP